VYLNFFQSFTRYTFSQIGRGNFFSSGGACVPQICHFFSCKNFFFVAKGFQQFSSAFFKRKLTYREVYRGILLYLQHKTFYAVPSLPLVKGARGKPAQKGKKKKKNKTSQALPSKPSQANTARHCTASAQRPNPSNANPKAVHWQPFRYCLRTNPDNT
jgi:hypothetical protein